MVRILKEMRQQVVVEMTNVKEHIEFDIIINIKCNHTIINYYHQIQIRSYVSDHSFIFNKIQTKLQRNYYF